MGRDLVGSDDVVHDNEEATSNIFRYKRNPSPRLAMVELRRMGDSSSSLKFRQVGGHEVAVATRI